MKENKKKKNKEVKGEEKQEVSALFWIDEKNFQDIKAKRIFELTVENTKGGIDKIKSKSFFTPYNFENKEGLPNAHYQALELTFKYLNEKKQTEFANLISLICSISA